MVFETSSQKLEAVLMRLFIALDIDGGIRQKIAGFMDGVRGFTPDARWVHPDSLHVTLKFVGEQPEIMVEQMRRVLATVTSIPFDLRFHNYGFFPTAKSARVFWIGISAGAQLAGLAADVDQSVSVLGVPKETHGFSPHLTLARGGGRSGSPEKNRDDRANRSFQYLQEKLAALPAPDFGTMTAHEFFLYRSQLSPKGSKYSKLAAFALKLAAVK